VELKYSSQRYNELTLALGGGEWSYSRPPTSSSRGKIPDSHLRGEWVDRRTGLDATKMNLPLLGVEPSFVPRSNLVPILFIYGSTALCLTFRRYFRFLVFYTVGRTTWTGDQPVKRPLSAHIRQHKEDKRTQTSMPQVGFELTVSVFERTKTVYASDRVVATTLH
jgi:hypothetical protein